jgi:hypothetical protein
MTSENSCSHLLSQMSYLFILLAVVVHVMMLGSLFGEPFAFEHGVNLTGTLSHPMEMDEYKGFLDSWFHDTDRVPRGLDFFSIYQAGQNFLRGDSVFYGVREHRDGPEALVVPYFSGFRYLPVYAFTFGVVLNALPPWHSYWTWIILVEILLLLNLYLTKFLAIDPVIRRTIVAMWLAYSPYYIELHIGQQSMVTTTLIHIVIIAHLNKSFKIRDTGYVFSVLWKINTVLFLPVWIKLKRWKTIAVLSVFTVTLSAPYFLTVEGSFQEFSSYFKHKFIAAGPNSLGFWAFLVQFFQETTLEHAAIRHALATWSLFIVATAAAATFMPRRICFYKALSLWICVYFLIYQYVWEHHFVMLLPVFTTGMLLKRLRRWTLLLWFFCAVPTPYILFNNPSLPMPQANWSLMQKTVYHGIKVVPLLLFYCVLIYQLIRNKAGYADDNQLNHHLDQLDPAGCFVSLVRTIRKT